MRIDCGSNAGEFSGSYLFSKQASLPFEYLSKNKFDFSGIKQIYKQKSRGRSGIPTHGSLLTRTAIFKIAAIKTLCHPTIIKINNNLRSIVHLKFLLNSYRCLLIFVIPNRIELSFSDRKSDFLAVRRRDHNKIVMWPELNRTI